MPASSGFTESRTLLLTVGDGAPTPAPYTASTPYTAPIPYTVYCFHSVYAGPQPQKITCNHRPPGLFAGGADSAALQRGRAGEISAIAHFLDPLPYGFSGKEKKGAGSQNAAPF